MLNNWRVQQTEPGAVTEPAELAGTWDAAADVEVPATVATVDQLTNTDDVDWWQRCTFTVDAPTIIEFAGLTFPASVFLDGVQVAECESMFLPLSIECDAGEHELVIHFGSLNHWLKSRRPRGRWRSALVGTPGLRWARTTLIGRAPVYGDIPAPVGIWRPINIGPARLRADVILTADAATGIVSASGSTAGSQARLVIRAPTGEVVADLSSASVDGEFRLQATVAAPMLWWPNGYGNQHLYRAAVEIDGAEVADRPFGFRTLIVDETSGFRIKVNDTAIFCRGATWNPPDPIRLYADPAQIRSQIKTFADSGATMIRVIGGLVYEQDEFWVACAEAGLLVWQDAMLATFDPPAEESELIARELISVLQAVSGNPSLAVVSGGSETLQQPEMLGLGPHESKMEVIDTLLPAAVARHSDAHYVRASPSQPPGGNELAIRPDTGVSHWFGVGGYLRPIDDIHSAGIKFATESLAFANPPSQDFIDRHFGSSAVAGHHPDWKAGVPRDRGSSWDFEDVRDFYARAVFGEELLAVRRTDPDRYLQLGRLAIATVMRECFAYWRRGDSGCGGALVLSSKDMRPGAGWGLLDSEGNTKAALIVLARTWAPMSVIVSDGGLSGVRIDIHNDTPIARGGKLSLIATNSVGTALDISHKVTIPPASSITLYDVDVSGHFRDLSHAFQFGPPTADAVQAAVEFDDGSITRDVLVVNPRGGQSASLVTAVLMRQSDDHWQLQVTAEVALRYVELDIPGWIAADNYFHLAPRATYTVSLSRRGEPKTPAGTVSSIDLVGAVQVRESL